MSATPANVVLFPLPEFGHTNAMLVLARKLRERGHRVSWICPIAPVREHVAANGYDVVPLGDEIDADVELVAGHLTADPEPVHRLLRRALDGSLDEYRDEVQHVERKLVNLLCGDALRDALVRAKTDLFLCDLAWNPPAMVAHSLGIRALLVSTTLPTFRLPGIPPISCGAAADPTPLSRIRAAGYWQLELARRTLSSAMSRLGLRVDEQRAMADAAARWGFAPSTIDFDAVHQFGPNLPLPRVILCSREFDYRFVPDASLHYIGPNVDLARKEIPFPWDRLDPSKRLIYCSLGAVGNQVAEHGAFFGRVLEAVRGHDDWQLVMTVSAGIEPDALGPLPASAIVVQHAPQLDLLRRAAVMLTAGGFNSLKECIVLGTPFVLFPMATDQPGNAARVRAHGIALTASLRRSTPPQIAELIRRTLDDSAMRARLHAMQAIFQRDDASDLAVRTIEGLARTAPRAVPDRGIA